MKKFLAVLLVCTVFLTLAACGSSITEEWTRIEIGNWLPTPQKGKLNIGSNLDDYFSGSIDKVNEDYYYEYKEACIQKGYTIDSESSGTRYESFNAEGYDLSIAYYSNAIHITFQKPDELTTIEWPKSGLAALLPVPNTLLGKVNSDSSESYRVLIGNTTIEGYSNYIQKCEDKGFVVDYIKNEKSYSAKNREGYRLNVSYEGCNRIDILIQTPKTESTTTITTTKATTTTTKASNDIDPDFKKAMDAYESFMNKYVDFMKKYQANPTDLGLLADYASYMSDYAKFCQDFEKWEDEDLNTAELAYYVDVQARVSKKLLEVAG